MAGKVRRRMAVVRCSGGDRAVRTVPRETLTGDCRQALLDHPEGVSACRWGCLGLGSCAAACRLEAIAVEGGLARVDRDKCVGCGLCVKACPQKLIVLVEREQTIWPACASQAAGADTRKACAAGCIACGICVKNCPADAIHLENNHPVIDPSRCVACGMCAVKCPRGVIRDAYGILGPVG